MGLLVPYDGSPLSKAALVRAIQFDSVLEEGVTAVTVIPRGNTSYVRNSDWIGPTDVYDGDAILATLRESVNAIAPDTRFEPIFVGHHAPYGTMASRIRRFARDTDTSIVFIGSDNAGRMVGSLTVGSVVASDRTYDTMIVSQALPSKVKKLEEELPSDDLMSQVDDE